jgi:hypothetical protein
VALTEQRDTDRVYCPDCSSDNVHLAGVAIFAREEDQGSLYIGVSPVEHRPQVTIIPDNLDNPSSRRAAVLVHFSCEADHWFTWEFNQHKGSTFFKELTK